LHLHSTKAPVYETFFAQPENAPNSQIGGDESYFDHSGSATSPQTEPLRSDQGIIEFQGLIGLPGMEDRLDLG
jgi:hypothetical protein